MKKFLGIVVLLATSSALIVPAVAHDRDDGDYAYNRAGWNSGYDGYSARNQYGVYGNRSGMHNQGRLGATGARYMDRSGTDRNNGRWGGDGRHSRTDRSYGNDYSGHDWR